MLFTSYAFIAFIAVAFFLYYRIPRKWQWPFLLIISIGFYASAGIFYPIFLLVSSAVTYLAGLWIERDRKQEKDYIRENGGRFASRQEKKEFKQKGEKRRRKLMVSAFLILLAVLGVFKYADFVIDNMNAVFMRLEVTGSWNIWIYCFQWEFPFIHFSRWDICWMYTGKKSMHRRIFSNICCLCHFFHNWYRDRSAVIPIYHRRCMKNMYLTKSR